MERKKVLIVSYTFPPSPGIGGRRWAKFAKYLHRAGMDVHVIASQAGKDAQSPWKADIEEYKDKITYIKPNYPKYLRIVPKTFFEKVMYRVALVYVKLLSKGNYYDPTSFFEKRLTSEIMKYISQGYNNVIVSGAPFQQTFFVAKLIDRYPNIHVITDFRDPWTQNRTAYGFENMSLGRQTHEMNTEKYVISHSDFVTSVSKQMNVYFKTLLSNSSTKFIEIPNGFDSDDIPPISINKNIYNSKIRFIFAGTFYEKAMYLVKLLSEELSKIQSESPETYKQFDFNFYGNANQEFTKIVETHSTIIKYHGRIPLHEVYKQIAKSDIAMLFLTDDINYSFSTKFYEYISLKKPIAVFSKGGYTGDYVELHKIGYNITPKNITEKLFKIVEDKQNKSLQIADEYDIEQHDVKNIARKIYDLLQ